MKILLISGHGAGDVGAIGNGYKEADLTREVVNILAPKLRQYAEVDIYDQNRNAYADVCNGKIPVNFSNYNYVFEVHFNAGGGKGTEIYVTREEKATSVEEKIMNKLSSFFTVRGVKRKNFAVINSVKKRGVSSALLETCFIDNANDVNIYQNNKEAICNAICEAIAEGFGLNGNTSNTLNIPNESITSDLQYKAHIQDIGWTSWKNAGEVAGTTGQEKRVEAIILQGNNGLDLKYRVHIQDIGWSNWVTNGQVAGTTGQSRRIEAIEIQSNKMLEVQEHVQNIGWMPSSKGNTIRVGTEGKALRLEAFKIRVI